MLKAFIASSLAGLAHGSSETKPPQRGDSNGSSGQSPQANSADSAPSSQHAPRRVISPPPRRCRSSYEPRPSRSWNSFEPFDFPSGKIEPPKGVSVDGSYAIGTKVYEDFIFSDRSGQYAWTVETKIVDNRVFRIGMFIRNGDDGFQHAYVGCVKPFRRRRPNAHVRPTWYCIRYQGKISVGDGAMRSKFPRLFIDSAIKQDGKTHQALESIWKKLRLEDRALTPLGFFERSFDDDVCRGCYNYLSFRHCFVQ